MRRAVDSKKPGWIACGAALLFHVFILTLQTDQQPGPGFLRSWLMDALTPMQSVLSGGIGGVSGVWGGYVDLVGVRAENEKLRAEIDTLRLQLHAQEQQVLEADRLRELMKLTQSGLGKTVVARVIARAPSRSQHTLTIDKGRDDGVNRDTSVIVGEGVVGRVFFASAKSATVQLITDSQSSIGAIVRSTRAQAVFRGTGGSELELDYIDNDNDIAEGDELVTSGLDRVHPKGIPLGAVTFVGPPGPPDGILKTIRIRPAADLSRIEEVVCVLKDPPAATDSLESPANALAPTKER